MPTADDPASPRPLLAVPIKPFDSAKGRLARALDPQRRRALAEDVAGRVVAAAAATGALPVVVTGDPEVAAWAHGRGIEVLAEPPGGGLDGAAAAAASGAAAAGTAWCILHGDLPLLGPADLEGVLADLAAGLTVLAPSRTGGTNLLAGHEPLPFAYGPGSFCRHLASAAHRPLRIRCSTALVLDLDTPDDLAAASGLPGGSWLRRYLT